MIEKTQDKESLKKQKFILKKIIQMITYFRITDMRI